MNTATQPTASSSTLLSAQPTPIFYQQLDHFRELLPHQKLLYDFPEEHPLRPLLNNYLRFYDIDFVEEGLAKYHSIWKTQASKSHTIVQQCWGVDQPKGLAVIAHGYFDHTGLYGPLIRYFLEQNIEVMCFDLPGHGLSTGDRGLIHHFNEYSHTLDGILRQSCISDTSQPLILAGQSTGCAIITNYLLNPIWDKDDKPIINHCILLAPLVRITGWPLLRLLYPLLKQLTLYVPRTFKQSTHRSSFSYFVRYVDPLKTERVPLKWLKAMDQWIKDLETLKPAQSTIPCTFIQGTGDNTVDWKYNLPALQRHFPKHYCHFISGAKHHLVNESDIYWAKVKKLLLYALSRL